MKVVLDSNIYVSAFLHDRGPERIINLGRATNFRIYSSLYIITEVKNALLHKNIGESQRFAALAAGRITRQSVVVSIRGSSLTGPSPTDPKDGPIIKTCLASKADFLVTGDRRLQTLEVPGLKIVSPTRFLWHLRSQGIGERRRRHW